MHPIDYLLFLAGVFASLPAVYGVLKLFDIATRTLIERRNRRRERRILREFAILTHPSHYTRTAQRDFLTGEVRG